MTAPVKHRAGLWFCRGSIAAVALTLAGCYSVRSSSGGGQTEFTPPRSIETGDVALPDGYQIEAVASGFTYPTGIAFDDSGAAFVVEAGYSYGEDWAPPRLLRIEPDGATTVVLEGQRDDGPWNGIVFHQGDFYIADAGVLHGGRIIRVTAEGELSVLIDGIPSYGDHFTSGPAIGPDGSLYFGQGTATNSGVVGPDNAKLGWLKRHERFHDVPGANITLRGQNYESGNALSERQDLGRTVQTGGYLPYGVPAREGQQVEGETIASGSVVRLPPEGGAPEQVAWGFRNPFGLAFSPDGQLYVTDNGYDNRGSRPVWGAPDLLWRVEDGLWYGWPDFSGQQALTDEFFQPPGGDRIQFLLAEHPNQPPKPVAKLAAHSSSNGFDFSRSPRFGHEGQAFIAQYGDFAPGTNKLMGPVGFKVVRVDVESGEMHDFAVNRGDKNGPASLIGGGGLERPIAARFNPDGDALYVVDFGVLTMEGPQHNPHRGTGVIWKIERVEDQP